MLLGRDGYADFPSTALLYEISNPLRPNLLCRISNTSAHVISSGSFEYLKPVSETETDVVVHTIETGQESISARLPFVTRFGSWLPDGSLVAYSVRQPGLPSDFSDRIAVWLFSAGKLAQLYTYPIGIGDCVCRFGLPRPVLAVSPDGQYLVSGWISGKGSAPLAVFRISDRTRIATFGPSVYNAIWAGAGHQLYLISFPDATPCCVQSWTPESGLTTLANANQWRYLPSLSERGDQVVYTAYPDPTNGTNPRVYLYDFGAHSTRMLVDQPRTAAVFVKDAWVWYDEEANCSDCTGGSTPTGRVFAMELPAGQESLVTFAAGDEPKTDAPWSPSEYLPA